MTVEPHFNLIDDGWIPVRLMDGSSTLLGIRDALLRAHEIREIETSGPTLWPPIVRVLLAVLHRIVDGPQDLEAWAQLFEATDLPSGAIDAYCRQWRHRFDLFDSDAPFMQCAGLNHASGPKPIASLIATRPSGNNIPIYQPVTEQTPFSLTFPEAAIWLLHAHAWDVAGLKGSAVGDPKAIAGKTTGNRVGSLGSYGVVIATGADLKQTLLLNLVSGDMQDVVAAPADDSPVWEQEPLTASWREREPRGRLDIYTWNARRIRLIPDPVSGQSVVGLVLAAGDRMQLDASFRRDPHTGFRRSPFAEKQTGRIPVYYPLAHSPERAAWRGLTSLLALNEAAAAASLGKDAPAHVAAGVLMFVGTLLNSGFLPADFVVRVRTVGTQYGAQNAVIAEQFEDHLDLYAFVLDTANARMRSVLERAAATANQVGQALGHLVVDALRAAGESDGDRRDSEADAVKAAFYADLDHDFRMVLAMCDPLAPLQTEADWHRTLRAKALECENQVIADAPTAALQVRDGINLARAVNQFESKLRQLIPQTAIANREEGDFSV